jgi:hypothetical protein
MSPPNTRPKFLPPINDVSVSSMLPRHLDLCVIVMKTEINKKERVLFWTLLLKFCSLLFYVVFVCSIMYIWRSRSVSITRDQPGLQLLRPRLDQDEARIWTRGGGENNSSRDVRGGEVEDPWDSLPFPQNVQFLGAFVKLRKATTRLIMSVRPPAWSKSAPTGRILMKFGIWVLLENMPCKVQVPLKSDRNNGYFTRRSLYICDSISLNSS